jgi:predicted nucleotidyltransferase
MHPLIETHRTELLALARRRGVTGVRVFGSMSRGDGDDNSDVDLLVTLAPGTSALALGGLLLDAQACWVDAWMSSPRRACTQRCASA